MVDVGLDDGGVHPELATPSHLHRARQFDGAVIEGCDCPRTYLVSPTDECGVVRSTLQIEPTELPQDDGIGDEAFGLFVAPSIESLDHQHPQDHFGRGGMPPEPS